RAEDAQPVEQFYLFLPMFSRERGWYCAERASRDQHACLTIKLVIPAKRAQRAQVGSMNTALQFTVLPLFMDSGSRAFALGRNDGAWLLPRHDRLRGEHGIAHRDARKSRPLLEPG